MIQNQDLSQSKELTAELLIPWKSVIPIKLIVMNEESIMVQNSMTPTYKINVEFNSIIGKLLPKQTLWVSKEQPHILIKQKGFNKNLYFGFV